MINRILCSLCFYIVFLANAFGLTHVSYINGAETNEIAATAQQILFKKTMVQNGVSGNIDWPDITIGQPFTESFVITACQAFVAKEAFPTPNSIPSSDSYYYYYFEKLGKIYKDKNDGCLLNGPFKSQLISRTEGLAAKIKNY